MALRLAIYLIYVKACSAKCAPWFRTLPTALSTMYQVKLSGPSAIERASSAACSLEIAGSSQVAASAAASRCASHCYRQLIVEDK
jgi:hypothetical protein